MTELFGKQDYPSRSLRFVRFHPIMNSVTTMLRALEGQNNLEKVIMPEQMNSLTVLDYFVSKCYSLRSISFPPSLPALTSMKYTFQYSGIETIEIPATPLCTSFYFLFYECYRLRSITFLGESYPLVTDIGFIFGSTPSLMSINALNLPGLTSVNIDVYALRECDFLNFGSPNIATSITFLASNLLSFRTNALLSRLSLTNSSLVGGALYNLQSVRLLNASSPFSGASPQITVRNSLLGRDALLQLFNDLPVLSGKTIDITGCIGTSSITATDRMIAISKGWSVTY
jgi:hypothetical protein